MRRPPLALLLAIVLLAPACDRSPAPPDVLLVSVERLPWEQTALEGGPVAAPTLSGLAREGRHRRELVSPAPGGAPAALSLLTGLPPSGHGLRRLDGAPRELRVPTLADVFGSEGWSTAAFSNVAVFPGPAAVAPAFATWMAPDDPLPLGLPGTGPREPVEAAVAHAQHWLRFLPHAEPAFAWLHVALPENADELERAASIAELDRLLGSLLAEAQVRGRHRQVAPVVVVTALSGLAPDDDHSPAFLLDAASVRTQAVLAGLETDETPAGGPVPLTDLHERLVRLARGEPPAGAAGGEAVLAETLLPMTALGAEPRLRAVRGPGAAAAPDPDPLVVQALAGDPGWSTSFRGPAPEEVLDEWRRLERARRELQAGRVEAARGLLEELLAGAGERARSATLLLGLAEIESGEAAPAAARLRSLAEELPPTNPTRRLALLALARAELADGKVDEARQVLTVLAEERPDDVDALVQLASLSDQAGDAAGALSALGRALEARPEDPRVLTFVARVHLARGRAAAASAAYGDALERRPVDHALLMEGAEAALVADDYWTALDRLTKHVLAYGETAEANFRMGRVFAAEGRWRSAGSHFSQALELDEGHHGARVALGEALLRSGNEKDGRAVLIAASARRRDSSLPCLSLLSWLRDEGRLEEARTELERCRSRHAGDGELARLAESLGAP